MKRVIALISATCLVCFLAGCTLEDYSNSTLTGQVTEVNGTEVTLQLGELTESESDMSGAGMPGGDMGGQDMSGGDMGTDQNSDQQGGMPSQDQGSDQNSGQDEGQGADQGGMPGGDMGGQDSSGGADQGGMPGGDMGGGNDQNARSVDSTSGDGVQQPDTSGDENTPMLIANADSSDEQGASDASSDSSGTAPADQGAAGEGQSDQQGDMPSQDQGSDQNSGQDEGQGGDQGGMSGGDMGGMPGGDMGGMGGSTTTFTAGDETATIDLGDATVTVEGGMGDTEESVSDIQIDDVLVIEVGNNNSITSVTVKNIGSGDEQGGGMGGGMPGGGDMSGSGDSTGSQGTAATTLDSDGSYANETYTSVSSDENALRVTGATVTLDNPTVEKNEGASSNAGEGDFYGMNAALLATDGAQLTINGGSVYSSVQGGNGIFSYGSGTTVNINDTAITTTSDNSGGIQTTGGGTTNATNLIVNTSGSSAAAIRSDRGGGNVTVERGSYVSNGFNSPAIYSTANINVKDAYLCANNSEAFVIEGKNSIALENCTCSGNMSSTQGTSSDENVHSVMIYQSMSGDAETGTSSFSMNGGTLTSNNGDVFYITNTQCTVSLQGVTIYDSGANGLLMRVCGNSGVRGWGSAGSNGGTATVTAADQILDGRIEVDTISKLNLTLSGSSTLNGVVDIVENAAGGSSVADNAVITIEEGSTWNLSDDCKVTSVDNRGSINYNGHTITLADGTVLNG